jgi:DNA repair protein RecN (Recombination protein N)
MLVELRAENYAVIDHAIASFGPGLNLLTGETGAGKSILVDALALLMGGKASADLVRHGADKAVVSCVFEATPAADAVLEENGLDAEGAEIILRREIATGGKGRVFVNNQPATVQVLKQLAPELALVHAQAETLSSFDESQQRHLLDRFAGISTEAVAQAYARWAEARNKLDELLHGEQDRLRMLDLWTYQLKEIEQARLEAGEDEKLETEKRVLANAEKLYTAAMGAFDELYESGSSAETSLRAAQTHVEELARYDARFADSARDLASARATLSDIATTLRDYAEGINASPDRLAEIEDRLAVLDRLKRKYGKTVAEVIAFGEEVARKLSEIEDRDELIKALRTALDQAAGEYKIAARALTAQRRAAAAKLAKLAESHINALAMKVRFEVSLASAEDGANHPAHSSDRSAANAQGMHEVSGHGFSRAANGAKNEEGALAPGANALGTRGQGSGSTANDAALKGHDLSRAEKSADSSVKGTSVKGTGFSPYIEPAKNDRGALAPEGNSSWTSQGWDTVEYLISTNPGEPLKPLIEIASGGELSRILLALKVAVEESSSKTKEKTTPRTLVFDEIDIGIGGRAAEAVGHKLKSLGRAQQVLCVTHLPQIAAFADQHLAVEKREKDGRTQTRIRVLDDEARTQEVARMLSGAKVTDTSLQHAAQMIAASK